VVTDGAVVDAVVVAAVAVAVELAVEEVEPVEVDARLVINTPAQHEAVRIAAVAMSGQPATGGAIATRPSVVFVPTVSS
jgi:hypothetical protein